MERLDRIASHDGIVIAVTPGRVRVRIEAVSACASCAAHGRCGFAESKEKEVDVPAADWSDYQPGQTVTVHIDESRGMLAVWLAYVLPALLMLAAIVGLSLARVPGVGRRPERLRRPRPLHPRPLPAPPTRRTPLHPHRIP